MKKYIYQKNKQKRNKDGSQSVLPSEQPKPATGECMKDSSSEDEEIEDENSDWEADQDVSDSDNDTKCDSRKGVCSHTPNVQWNLLVKGTLGAIYIQLLLCFVERLSLFGRSKCRARNSSQSSAIF